jgi:hypothetical protein
MDYNKIMEVIRGSKQFTFDGTVLTIQGYFTGSTVRLDLGKLTPEMITELSSTTYEIRPDFDEHTYDVVEVDWEGNVIHLEGTFDSYEEAVEYCEDNDYEWYDA